MNTDPTVLTLLAMGFFTLGFAVGAACLIVTVGTAPERETKRRDDQFLAEHKAQFTTTPDVTGEILAITSEPEPGDEVGDVDEQPQLRWTGPLAWLVLMGAVIPALVAWSWLAELVDDVRDRFTSDAEPDRLALPPGRHRAPADPTALLALTTSTQAMPVVKRELTEVA